MNSLSLILENLESRVLLSGSVLVDGASLVVDGTAGDDLVEVRQNGSELRVLVNDFDHGTFQLPAGRIRTLASYCIST